MAQKPSEHKAEKHVHGTRKAAAVALAASLLAPSVSRALPASAPPDVERQGPSSHTPKKDEDKPQSQRPNRSGGGFQAEENGVSATVSLSFAVSGDANRYSMEYNTKDGEPVSFSFITDSGAGEVRKVFIGEERSVIITENKFLIVLGYGAAARNDTGVVIDGVLQRGMRCVGDSLPEEFRGENLSSSTMVRDAGGEYLLLLSRTGRMSMVATDRNGASYIDALLEPSGDYILYGAGSLAFLIERESSTVYAISSSSYGLGAMNMVPVRLPFPLGADVSVSGSGRDVLISSGEGIVLLIVGEEGNAGSVTAAGAE